MGPDQPWEPSSPCLASVVGKKRCLPATPPASQMEEGLGEMHPSGVIQPQNKV